MAGDKRTTHTDKGSKKSSGKSTARTVRHQQVSNYHTASVPGLERKNGLLSNRGAETGLYHSKDTCGQSRPATLPSQTNSQTAKAQARSPILGHREKSSSSMASKLLATSYGTKVQKSRNTEHAKRTSSQDTVGAYNGTRSCLEGRPKSHVIDELFDANKSQEDETELFIKMLGVPGMSANITPIPKTKAPAERLDDGKKTSTPIFNTAKQTKGSRAKNNTNIDKGKAAKGKLKKTGEGKNV